MTAAATLAVELATEELPPKALRRLGEAFAATLADGLRARGFLGDASAATPYATPRRLAVTISQVRGRSPDQPYKQKVLPVSVAFGADGKPTPALAKKLAAMGLAESDLARMMREPDGKAEALFYAGVKPGRALAEGLQEALDEAIAKLPIPKVMRYAAAGSYYNDIAFVRPAHRLLALHGAGVVPVTALGLAAGRMTDGHRFLSRKGIEVATADAYAETLRAEGKVIASFDERRATIAAQLDKAAQGDRVVAPDALLDEVTALVEWPVACAGTFDPAFLAVPQECLILTMQQNQKYFALTDAAGKMRARFLLVSNLAAQDTSAIVGGNERVLRARLADARFFFEQDRKARLESRLPKLDAVVYLAKLGAEGSQGKRVARLAALARAIAPATGAAPEVAERAARLAKADLVTDMVGEFPELQGTMGRYYAQHDGEPAEVADAIAQHYWPRFAGDALPEGPVAQAVALADKMESMAGLFGVGQVPSGDKDPFGLRRAAIGVVRILAEKGVALDLGRLIALAFAAFEGVPGFKPAAADLAGFIEDRLRGWLREQGASAHQVEALLSVPGVPLPSLPARLAAVQAFESLPEAAALAAANKRIVNILRKSGGEAAAAIDRALLGEGAERDLWLAFGRLGPQVDADMTRGDYAAALRALATAKPAVDRFFDDVMVMAEDPAVRANRLALLRSVAATMNAVADISRLAA
ncbi:MAG: glycine--tRNA ligase subunit beta [Betaproteobacteria bacterium]|nr:glycine--tRNA ligase subunit beta [Betaproteobacteria bacterium]MDH5286151.1 glycine--tRNA ligase subunit beta [Betaproteobacteria bacterium]